MTVLTSPADLKWIRGNLPPVETVADGYFLLAWMVCTKAQPYQGKSYEGVLSRIILVVPHEDTLNSRKWCDTSYQPIGFFGERVGFYTWVVKC